jgi:hypothetical protein
LHIRITRKQAAAVSAAISWVETTEYYNGHNELREVLRDLIQSHYRYPAGGRRLELDTMPAGALGEALAAAMAANIPATERATLQRLVVKYQMALGQRETAENWQFNQAIKAAAARARNNA